VRFRRYGILHAVLLVSLLLLTVQTRGGGTGRAGELVAIAVTPVQSLLVRIHRGALGFWANYVDWKAVRRENVVLRGENEQLRVMSLQAGETREENTRLRRLLLLKNRLPLSTVAGEVIGREAGGWVRSLTVNRGRGDGIAQQTPVIVPDGLVGRVVQVHRGAAVIQLLNDPASTVGAVVLRTRTAGLVEGDAGGTVRFKFMARDGSSVAPGDLVVTSGLGTLFPKGLPVGRVVKIEDKGSALFHFAVLAPAVDFSRVEEVLLVTGQTSQDLAALFPTDDG
jgi:rod shape-determining protein MreC